MQDTSKDGSSRLQMIIKMDVLKDFAIFTGKYLGWSLFLITLQVLRSASLLEGDSLQVLSCGKYCQIFKNSYFIENTYLWWLLLKMSY